MILNSKEAGQIENTAVEAADTMFGSHDSVKKMTLEKMQELDAVFEEYEAVHARVKGPLPCKISEFRRILRLTRVEIMPV
jgi:hypothetical protein